MKRLISALIITIWILSFTGLVFAEEAVTNPPTPPAAGQAQPAQPAPQATAPERSPELKPDPSGANTGGAADVVGASANAPTADDLKNLGQKSLSRRKWRM